MLRGLKGWEAVPSTPGALLTILKRVVIQGLARAVIVLEDETISQYPPEYPVEESVFELLNELRNLRESYEEPIYYVSIEAPGRRAVALYIGRYAVALFLEPSVGAERLAEFVKSLIIKRAGGNRAA